MAEVYTADYKHGESPVTQVKAILLTQGQYIVDMASAKLGAPRETALGLDRNHSEICKFLGKYDRAYEGVEPNLRAMAESSRGHNVQCDHRTITRT